MALPTLCVLLAELLSNKTTVRVYYSAAINTTDGTTTGNYSIPGLTVTGASVNTTTAPTKAFPGTVVDLTVTGANAYTAYTMTVSNVRTVSNGYTMVAPDNTAVFIGGINHDATEEVKSVGPGIRQPRTLVGLGYVLTFATPTEISDDVDPPIFQALSPSPGSTLATGTSPITVDVLDFSLITLVQIFVKFFDGEEEVVYDGTDFTELYVANSSKSTLVGLNPGFRFVVQREGEWLKDPTLVCYARDLNGNIHNLSTEIGFVYTPAGGGGGGTIMAGANFNTGFN